MEKIAPAKSNLLNDAKECLVGSAHAPVSSVQLNVSPYDRELYISTVTQNNYHGFDEPSASFDPEAAQFAALMKAVARKASLNRPKRSIVARPDQLKHPYTYLGPSTFAPLEKDRAAERCLKPFSPFRRYHWVIGTSYDGHPVYIPEDLVYRGSPKDMLYIANASGVAAHPDPLEAIKLATLSRIKADACMRTWYKALAPYRLAPEYLPEQITSRIEHWRELGRTLTVSQLDNDYGEVYLATIRGNNFPCFASGVGITITGETEAALLEAVANVEANFGVLAGFMEKGWQADNLITMPIDHALHYAEFENQEKLNFLEARTKTARPYSRPKTDFISLARELALTVYWFTSSSERYQAVRVFSPHLVPISYGYGLEHSTHAALSYHEGNVSPDNAHIRHCFYNP